MADTGSTSAPCENDDKGISAAVEDDCTLDEDGNEVVYKDVWTKAEDCRERTEELADTLGVEEALTIVEVDVLVLLAAAVLAARVVLLALMVPEGLSLNAMYPNNPADVFPQFSYGKPGHARLQEPRETWSPGTWLEHQQELPWTTAKA